MSIPKVEEVANQITTDIDAACAPGIMTKTEAIEFLELVGEHCRSAVEALNDEIANEEE